MSTRRPDMYGTPHYPQGARVPPAGPSAAHGRPAADTEQAQLRAADAARAEALRGVPKKSARAGSAANRARETMAFGDDERKLHEERAQIFSLIIQADRLERVWGNDGISNDEYEEACKDLIRKYNTLIGPYGRSVPDVRQFGIDYRCNAAQGAEFGYRRLVLAGIPATREHGMLREERNKQVQRVHECTEAFISLMDTIGMGHVRVEDLVPDVRSLYKALCNVEGLDHGFKFKEQLGSWNERLDSMGALSTLSAEDLAKFKLQVESGYEDYRDWLVPK